MVAAAGSGLDEAVGSAGLRVKARDIDAWTAALLEMEAGSYDLWQAIIERQLDRYRRPAAVARCHPFMAPSLSRRHDNQLRADCYLPEMVASEPLSVVVAANAPGGGRPSLISGTDPARGAPGGLDVAHYRRVK